MPVVTLTLGRRLHTISVQPADARVCPADSPAPAATRITCRGQFSYRDELTASDLEGKPLCRSRRVSPACSRRSLNSFGNRPAFAPFLCTTPEQEAGSRVGPRRRQREDPGPLQTSKTRRLNSFMLRTLSKNSEVPLSDAAGKCDWQWHCQCLGSVKDSAKVFREAFFNTCAGFSRPRGSTLRGN